MSRRIAQEFGARQRMKMQPPRRKRPTLLPSVLDTTIGQPIQLPSNEQETWLLMLWRINQTLEEVHLDFPRVTKVVKKKLESFADVSVVDYENYDQSILKVEVQGLEKGIIRGLDVEVFVDHSQVRADRARMEQMRHQESNQMSNPLQQPV